MSMDDLLRELQVEYINSIPEKVVELRDFFANKDLENLINAFHKLKGSGKTYGLDEVTLLGQFFEMWLREKGEKALPFTLKAVEILEKIYQSRLGGNRYSIETDQEFLKLEELK